MTRQCLFGLAIACGLAAAVPVHAGYVIGSGNTAVIDPPVTHPAETPCIVPLYSNAVFGANNVNFTYTPPAACPGPWAKVILQMDIGLDAGIQYDRTGTLWINGVNIWFGTTSEPNPTLAPNWRVERDVTDYTALFTTAQSGFVNIGNYTNSVDTSVITTSGQLAFYPATTAYPAPRTPDMIVPLSAPGGGTVALSDGTQLLTATATLPTNIEQATMDVFLQGQGGDEFWYTCVPAALASQLSSCSGGPFREGEITVDGTPAGVSPVYPWIFTGGIDPYLWAPLPGVQTLDFKPFRAELTPFAGLLNNGLPHTFAISVFGDSNYFSTTANLFLFLDHGATSDAGALTTNTLAATITPRSVTHVNTTASGTTLGIVDTFAEHDFVLAGTLATSHGSVATTVHQTTSFSSQQNFTINAAEYIQAIRQATATTVQVTTKDSTGVTVANTALAYPLAVRIAERFGAKGGLEQTAIDQQYLANTSTLLNGATISVGSVTDTAQPFDTLFFNSLGQITGDAGQKSTDTYVSSGTGQPCFNRLLTAASSVLATATTTTGCAGK